MINMGYHQQGFVENMNKENVSYFSLYCVNLCLPLPGGMHCPVLIFIGSSIPDYHSERCSGI